MSARGAPPDIPPRLYKLLLAIAGVASSALALAAACFVADGGAVEVAGAAAAAGPTAALGVRWVLRAG